MAGKCASSQKTVFIVADSLQPLIKYAMPIAVDIADLHTFTRRIGPILYRNIDFISYPGTISVKYASVQYR
jgi:hypothetical protein